MDTRIFGLEKGAPSESTMHNILGDLSGLAQRKRAEAYREAGAGQPSLDMLGRERAGSQLGRVVPEEPESAAPEHLEQLRGFTAAMAKRCIGTLKTSVVRRSAICVSFFRCARGGRMGGKTRFGGDEILGRKAEG